MIRPRLLTQLTPSLIASLLGASCLDRDDSAHTRAQLEPARPIVHSPALPEGSYPVQSVSYDDATGSYAVFVLNVPAGHKPLYQHTDVAMARISDEDIASGKKSYLAFDASGTAALHLTPELQITYTHNVTEEQVDPRTGSREVVVVRQESSMWSPFASAMAGAAIGNMLFAPRYYYPPPYSAGLMSGYGGMGESRSLASQQYAQRFGSEPQAARLSKTGMAPKRASSGSLRSSGQGAGSSRLRSGPRSAPPARSRGFGLGRGRRR